MPGVYTAFSIDIVELNITSWEMYVPFESTVAYEA